MSSSTPEQARTPRRTIAFVKRPVDHSHAKAPYLLDPEAAPVEAARGGGPGDRG
ncbi:hypothetical protein [Jiangella asiatica]|uniref:hypothetical protein n=1 Tax=Jiangella asiatica TaxID=2530372 RepID=UPI0013A5C11B|nr:hypothetical protein [Jiangella asiatica]